MMKELSKTGYSLASYTGDSVKNGICMLVAVYDLSNFGAGTLC